MLVERPLRVPSGCHVSPRESGQKFHSHSIEALVSSKQRLVRRKEVQRTTSVQCSFQDWERLMMQAQSLVE